jgi:hypothetical protein
MRHQVPHGLDKADAKRATVAALEGYRQRFAAYSPTAVWVSDDRADISFRVKGMILRGNIVVNPTTLDLELDVPFLLRPFARMAVPVIDREIEKQLNAIKAEHV